MIRLCRRGLREEQAGRKRIEESGGERDATNPRPVLPSATSLSVSSFLRSPQNADHADALAVICIFYFCTPKVENAHVTCGIKLQVKFISTL